MKKFFTIVLVSLVLSPVVTHAEGESCQDRCSQVGEEGKYDIEDGQGGTSQCCCKDNGSGTMEPQPMEACVEE